MTWRAEQAKQTRQKILDTVVNLLNEGHPAALSIPQVSRSSGISVATIYRYFGTKEQLLDAAALEGTTASEAIALRAQLNHAAGTAIAHETTNEGPRDRAEHARSARSRP